MSALLAAAFTRPEAWTKTELDRIGIAWSNLTWTRQDLDACAAVLDRWIALDTGSAEAHLRHLTVDVYRGAQAAANARVAAIVDGPLDLRRSSPGRAHVEAAIRHLLGDGWNYRRQALLPEDLPVLDRLARELIAVEDGQKLAASIVGDGRFATTDLGRTLLGELRSRLLDPAHIANAEVGSYAALANHALEPETLSTDEWNALTTALEARHAKAADRYGRSTWADTLLRICDARSDTERAWRDLVEHLPQDADGHRRLAQQRERSGRWDAAAGRWAQVVRTRPDDPEGWLSLAQAQRRAGDGAGCRKTAEHVLETEWDARHGDVKVRAAALLR